jgi:hypothetical protein
MADACEDGSAPVRKTLRFIGLVGGEVKWWISDAQRAGFH